jgi:hypothetical protein
VCEREVIQRKSEIKSEGTVCVYGDREREIDREKERESERRKERK